MSNKNGLPRISSLALTVLDLAKLAALRFLAGRWRIDRLYVSSDARKVWSKRSRMRRLALLTGDDLSHVGNGFVS